MTPASSPPIRAMTTRPTTAPSAVKGSGRIPAAAASDARARPVTWYDSCAIQGRKPQAHQTIALIGSTHHAEMRCCVSAMTPNASRCVMSVITLKTGTV